jgi:GT2 family glycosyltransferase
LQHLRRRLIGPLRKRAARLRANGWLPQPEADSDAYRAWRRRHEPGPAALDAQRREVPAGAPLISILMPVYNTPRRFLEAAIESVLAQTYSNWQLLMADGASAEPWIHPVLEEYARRDTRIQARFLSENGGISRNTNALLPDATGEFIGFLDHDDTLAPFALFELVKALNQHPDADLLYSDEDLLDPNGERWHPRFKPDWSPETLLGSNYLLHFLVVRSSLLRDLGGLRPEFDGSQDHDLALRAGEQARRVVHIPHVLYHWRQHAASTALNPASKSYAVDAGRRAVQEALKRRGVIAEVAHHAAPGYYHVRPGRDAWPSLSIVIPNRDRASLLRRCVQSIRESGYPSVEVVVVENASEAPETWDCYEELKTSGIRIETWEKSFNYSAINNWAAARTHGELLLFLNNDVHAITADWLKRLAGWAMAPQVGGVGAMLLHPAGTIQHAGIIVGLGGVPSHIHSGEWRGAPGFRGRLMHAHDVAAVTGACLMLQRRHFDEVQGFDERFAVNYNDVDLCLKLRERGYRIVMATEVEMYHLESATRGPRNAQAAMDRLKLDLAELQAKWAAAGMLRDPYFNPDILAVA